MFMRVYTGVKEGKENGSKNWRSGVERYSRGSCEGVEVVERITTKA